jgi:cytochrome c553
MKYFTKLSTVAITSFLLTLSTAHAGDSPADIKARIGKGDPVAGKDKSAMCQGCHGEDGNSAAPTFPKLAGQYANYLQKQVHDFQSEARVDPTMSGMAQTVTEHQDLLDITAYFASQKQMKGDAATANSAGKKLYLEGNDASGVYGCVNCHGENGKGKSAGNPMFPVIGGQHKDYLVKQLTDFNAGTRTNDPAGMMGTLAKLMTNEEIEAVADYLSGL